MWDYTEKVRELFLQPKNVGAIENPDAIGEVGSLSCGDALKLYLKIENERIVDAKFETFGCASAIASSSILTEIIKGKTLDEALKISNKDIAAQLGGLPKEKMHCSVMGQEALEAAINNYRGIKNISHDHDHEDTSLGEIICTCFGVTDVQVRRAIVENNLSDVESITNYTKAGGGCGGCIEKIESILNEVRGIKDLRPKPTIKKINNLQRTQLVLKVTDEVIRPMLAQDGGDIEIVDIDGPIVKVAMRGMCSNCNTSHLTIQNLVEKTLKEQVDINIIVREVTA